MAAVIIFDASSRQNEVISAMINIGYTQSWIKQGVPETVYYLPKNTLWKPDVELVAAKNDLMSVVAVLNSQSLGGTPITLQRCLVLAASPWESIPNSQAI